MCTVYADEARVWTPGTTSGSYTSGAKTLGTSITSVTPFWNTTVPTGTNLWINVSRDGTNWNASTLSNGVKYSFPSESSGNSFAYKAEFRTNGYYPSILYDVKFVVEYIDTGIALSTTFTGETAGDRFGWSVAGAGNIGAGLTGDSGIDDVIIGAPFRNSNAGAVYIFNGSATLSGTILASDADYTKAGSAGSRFGWSVSRAGDLNGDGHNDVIVGAPEKGPSSADGTGWAQVLAVIIPEFSAHLIAIFLPLGISFIVFRKRRKSKHGGEKREAAA